MAGALQQQQQQQQQQQIGQFSIHLTLYIINTFPLHAFSLVNYLIAWGILFIEHSKTKELPEFHSLSPSERLSPSLPKKKNKITSKHDT